MLALLLVIPFRPLATLHFIIPLAGSLLGLLDSLGFLVATTHPRFPPLHAGSFLQLHAALLLVFPLLRS